MKRNLKKVWHFIWEDNSIWSWIVNIILAFVLIKFIVYPVLGLVLSTSHPVVAVVSGSMEHNGMDFEQWWEKNNDWYLENGIDKAAFGQFSLKNGFNKGDIMILVGKDAGNIKMGDVLVFINGGKDPIIHRVVKKADKDGMIHFQTKGDNNGDSIKTQQLDETNIAENEIIGKAVLRVPLLGYIKIGFVEMLRITGIQ